MKQITQSLPQIGDQAPAFEVQTEKGLVRFPEYSQGFWCVFFAHPVNFTSTWEMFSAYLAMKERWLDERNTKVLALANEALRPSNYWADTARRFLGIYLKGPVIEDLDFQIARQYGLASARRPQPGCDRLALIIDPVGVVRLIIHRPLLNIEAALLEIEQELDRLQGKTAPPSAPRPGTMGVDETPDAIGRAYQTDPAYFLQKDFHLN